MVAETSNPEVVAAFKKWAKGRRQIALTVPLNPVPASRPRVSKYGGVYYLKTYATWKKQALLYLPSGEPLFPTEPVVCLAEHFVLRPKTTKLQAPRGDVDNFAKASLDAITQCGAIWSDDDQVVALISTKQFTKEDPRTSVLVVTL